MDIGIWMGLDNLTWLLWVSDAITGFFFGKRRLLRGNHWLFRNARLLLFSEDTNRKAMELLRGKHVGMFVCGRYHSLVGCHVDSWRFQVAYLTRVVAIHRNRNGRA